VWKQDIVMNWKLTEDAKRLLRENLSSTWQKSVAFALFVLTILPVMGVALKENLPLSVKLKVSFGVLIAAFLIYLLYFLSYSLRRAYLFVPESVPAHRHLADILSLLFGLRKTSLAIECTISADGSSKTTYDVSLLAVAKGITQIEYVSTTPTLPDGCAELEPQFVSTKSGVTMRVEILKRTSRECFWAVNFSPELKPGHAVEYRHVLASPAKTFAVTAEEMQSRKLALESYSTMVTYPTDSLRIRVTFDGGAKPWNVLHDVWLGRGRVRHLAEYSRVVEEKAFTTDTDENGRLYGEILLNYPIHGLRYVVTWTPEKARPTAQAHA
jgi:hypothetical protein